MLTNTIDQTMRKSIALLLLSTAIVACQGSENPPRQPPAPIDTAPRREGGSYIEIESNDLRRAFVELARKGRVKVVLDEAIRGKVNVHIRVKDPLLAIRALAEAKGLKIQRRADVYYISK